MTEQVQTDTILIANLHPLYTPEPVAFAPETIGWYLLGALMMMLVGFVFYRWIKRQKARRYRKVAVEMIELLESDLSAGAAAYKVVPEISGVLKRVAIKSYRRMEVARLSGEAWINFLSQSAQGIKFHPETLDILTTGQYQKPEDVEKLDSEQIKSFSTDLKNWIKHHRV